MSYGPRMGIAGPEGQQRTDAGLEAVARMESLPELDLSGQKGISDAGLKQLGGISTLVVLKLSMADFGPPGAGTSGKSRITDEGIAHLASLKNMKRLDISGIDITDDGLAKLQGLTSLEWLSIHTCPKLTTAGIAAIRAALPNCSLSTDEDRPPD